MLLVNGYPEQEGGSVAAIRDGEVVASYAIVRLGGDPWAISAGSACAVTGLPFEGMSVG